MNEVVIVAAARTAIGRAPKGSLREMRSDDLAAVALSGVLARAKGISPTDVDDVILGCATPEHEQGMDIARLSALRAGLNVPGVTLNRFCASGLEAIATAAAKIATGQAEVILAGGAESMSQVPFMGEDTLRPNPNLPGDTYLNMGLSVEQLAKKYGITRADADAFALQSQQRALSAQDAGRFDAEIVPLTLPDGTTFSRDEGPRRETTAEGLAGLRLAFDENGTITAGNASQRSDGAAAVLLTTRQRAAQAGLEPLARFVSYAVASVAPVDFGIAPSYAIPKALEKAGIGIEEVGLMEFNEAFAAQVLAASTVYPLPFDRMNVNGGAVALGHPLGATGARQTVTLLHEARRRGDVRYGVVTMCAALGMGAAGVFAFD
jgi:acetyl-CoA acyltransferase